MANEEIKYFNVKNTSIRLVHIGGVMILPEEVKPLIDDDLGINRASVEDSDYLEVTDEEPEQKDDEKKPAAKKVVSKTPTGAGWNANKA